MTQLGPDHLVTAEAHQRAAPAYRAAGRFDDAITHARVGVSTMERAAGERHMLVAEARAVLARALTDAHHVAEARAEWERVLALEERFPAGHEQRALEYLSWLAILAGSPQDAEHWLAQAQAHCASADCTDSIRLNLELERAAVYGFTGRLEEALAVLADVEDRADEYGSENKHLGPEIPVTIEATRGVVLAANGRFAAADEAFERARAAWTPQNGAIVDFAWAWHAVVLAEMGRGRDAIDRARETLALVEGVSDQSPSLALARLALARGMLQEGVEPERARTLAWEAIASLEAQGPVLRREAERARVWMESAGR